MPFAYICINLIQLNFPSMNYNTAGKYSAYVLIAVLIYLFTSICSNNFNPQHWEVVARLFFGTSLFFLLSTIIPPIKK